MDLFNQIINSKDNDLENNDRESYCLISNSKLEKNYITLECGHSFNYIPLYHEVVYQKTKRLLDNHRLHKNQIKCPYCRSITNSLLPFYKYYTQKQIIGVNAPYSLTMKTKNNKCEYFNKKTNTKCCNDACNTNSGFFCNKHISLTYKQEEVLETISKVDYNMYNKKTILVLKNLLRLNNCKVSGKKDELISRILLNKNNTNWIND
tara:strand:- start:3954 stop:4571 length:618 start_codon:yes stop_codon:yes gene_type:complete